MGIFGRLGESGDGEFLFPCATNGFTRYRHFVWKSCFFTGGIFCGRVAAGGLV